MKNIQCLVKGLMICAVALATAGTVVADTSEGAAKIVRIKGKARYSTGNNVWVPLSVGDVLRPGTTINTASGSYVDLVLGDASTGVPRPLSSSEGGTGAAAGTPPPGTAKIYQPLADQNIIRVYENSMLAIDKLTSTETGDGSVSEVQLDLQKGKIFGNAKKLSAGSKYEVKLPNGMAGIRGTIYTLSSDGVVSVLVGSVVVAYVGPDGNVVTQVVMGGYQFDARSGQVAPIPNFDQKDMVKLSKETRVGPNTPPTQFTVDQTIYFVSPTTGHNGNSGASSGNGGNGGNGG